MIRDDVLLGFFQSLRVAFKNASMYKMDHPAFIRCVEDLKARIEEVLAVSAPLSLGFTPRSLYADGRFWEGEKTFRQLGMLFHLRKVKKLEIRPGITLDELMKFAAKLTLPLRDYVKLGGAARILKEEKILHISVEELDYADLLRHEGEEIKELWPYLLQEAVEENDIAKIDEVAASFHRIVGKLDTAELVVDKNTNKNIAKFFSYLKENEASKYRACAKDLLKTFVTDKSVNLHSKVDNLRLLITDLSEEDLASTLWEEIISDDKFDSISFSVFSKLLEADRHRKVSDSLKLLFQTENPLNTRAEVEDKVKALLSGTSNQFISEAYRQTLNSLLENIQFDKKILFDHQALAANYRYILLDLLTRETKADRFTALVDRVLASWEGADFAFLASFQEVLLEKRSAFHGESSIARADAAIGDCVEKAVIEGESSPHFERLLSGLMESRLGVDVYLVRMFVEGRVTPFILRAYYRFFKDHMDDLTVRLKEKRHDADFLKRMAAAAGTIDSPLSLAILKVIVQEGNEAAGVEALRAMGRLSEIDKNFLFPLLRSPKISIRGEALVLLARSEATRKRALDKFLRFQSPYGLLNRKLRTHIQIVESLDLRLAAGHLERLASRKSRWNSSVRREARRVLEKWHEARH